MTPKQIIYPLRYYTSPWQGDAEKDEARFIDGLSKRLRLPHGFVPLGRARTGIYLLVKQYLSRERDKVLLSPYTIPDVVNMVIFAGGTPVFLDHEPRSTNIDVQKLENAIDDRTACVMITHYHVNQMHTQEMHRVCKEKGAALVEDCAISLAGTIGGKPVGMLADGGVYSLSSYKFLNYFWGGALVVPDRSVQEKIAGEVQSWKRFRTSDYKSQVLRTLKYDMATRPVLFDCVTGPLLRWKQRRSSEAQVLHQPRIESETFDTTLCSRPAKAAFVEWNRKLGNVEKYLAHRREVAAIYDKYLGELMVAHNTPQEVVAGSCFVNFPVWIGERRDAVYKKMLLDRFDVGLSLYPNAHQHTKFKSVEGNSDEVARLCASVISLPTHPRVSLEYAEALARHLKKSL